MRAGEEYHGALEIFPGDGELAIGVEESRIFLLGALEPLPDRLLRFLELPLPDLLQAQFEAGVVILLLLVDGDQKFGIRFVEASLPFERHTEQVMGFVVLLPVAEHFPEYGNGFVVISAVVGCLGGVHALRVHGRRRAGQTD